MQMKFSVDILKVLIVDHFFKKKNLSVLIWVQTVCKGYQLMTKITAIKERFNIKKIMNKYCSFFIHYVHVSAVPYNTLTFKGLMVL